MFAQLRGRIDSAIFSRSEAIFHQENPTKTLFDELDQPDLAYLTDVDVAVNTSGICCPRHSACSVTDSGSDTERQYLNANQISFNGVRSHIAGQSPQAESTCSAQSLSPLAGGISAKLSTLDRYLIQGIESGKGLYQFVSPRAHQWSTAGLGKENLPVPSEIPIIDQLLSKLNGNQSVLIANRYKVSVSKDSSHDSENTRRVVLTVVDTTGGAHAAPKLIPLTQVAFPFRGRVLSKESLKRADELFDDHCKLVQKAHLPGDVDTSPAVISFAGIGRNAALIVFQEMKAQIREGKVTKDNFHDVLKDVINTGRNARGPRFLHSADQLGVLIDALTEVLDTKEGQDGAHSNTANVSSSAAQRSLTQSPVTPAKRTEITPSVTTIQPRAIFSDPHQTHFFRDTTRISMLCGLEAINSYYQNDVMDEHQMYKYMHGFIENSRKEFGDIAMPGIGLYDAKIMKGLFDKGELRIKFHQLPQVVTVFGERCNVDCAGRTAQAQWQYLYNLEFPGNSKAENPKHYGDIRKKGALTLTPARWISLAGGISSEAMVTALNYLREKKLSSDTWKSYPKKVDAIHLSVNKSNYRIVIENTVRAIYGITTESSSSGSNIPTNQPPIIVLGDKHWFAIAYSAKERVWIKLDNKSLDEFPELPKLKKRSDGLFPAVIYAKSLHELVDRLISSPIKPDWMTEKHFEYISNSSAQVIIGPVTPDAKGTTH
jgi:hypothetical protein